MHFKHPEILYFLFLLIIPILVHLFQLRKFKTEFFTNVQILKQLSIQTRKSSKIKKWLLLAARLLLLAFLILAFAQPFFQAKDSFNAKNELFVVLDNSFSMQAEGQEGPLLKRAIEDLLKNVPENKNFSLITCSDKFFETNIKSIQKDLQNLKYCANEFQIDNILTQINAKKSAQNKDILVITDAIGIKANQVKSIPKSLNLSFVIPQSEQQNNVAIDSVFINQTLENFYEIGVKLRAYGKNLKPISISLFNQKKLEAKTILTFTDATKVQKFTIPKADFQGHVFIEDNSLDYDNSYFFNISKPKISNVISIGESSKSIFLSKIYTIDAFKYSNYEIQNLDYNALENQDAIILNELSDLPQALQMTLQNFVKKGGNLVYIPSKDQNTQKANIFLKNFGYYEYKNFEEVENQITKIVFEHPIYNDVFEKKATTFQYPKTKASFTILTNANMILGFENQSPFLASITNNLSNVYVFSAPINKQNSNFQNAPLIVPTFFKMAKSSASNQVSAYTISKKSTYIVKSSLSKDEILEIKNDFEKFVPLQQILNQKVQMSFSDLPSISGNFGVFNKNNLVDNISFNYNRTEGNLSDSSVNLLSDYKIVASIDSFFDGLQFDRADNQIWKWFIVLSLLFLFFEILIQKFVK